jgi:hypothetical protein
MKFNLIDLKQALMEFKETLEELEFKVNKELPEIQAHVDLLEIPDSAQTIVIIP